MDKELLYMDYIFKILKTRLNKNKIWIMCCRNIAFENGFDKIRCIGKKWLIIF